MEKASFTVKKIATDSRKLMDSFEKEARHTKMNEFLEEPEKGYSEKVLSQFGVRYSVDLNENRSFKSLTIGKSVSSSTNEFSGKGICCPPWLLPGVH